MTLSTVESAGNCLGKVVSRVATDREILTFISVYEEMEET